MLLSASARANLSLVAKFRNQGAGESRMEGFESFADKPADWKCPNTPHFPVRLGILMLYIASFAVSGKMAAFPERSRFEFSGG